MKKLLDFGSLALIVVTLFLIGYLYLPQAPANAADSSGKFRDFPVGQTQLINLAARREALEDLSPREQQDQMRDWLLFTAASSAGLSAEGINQALFDVPPIRHGYLQPVANFEYGDTRSCYIGNGQVIALLPADTSDERNERLARIADEQRKNLGAKPARLIVFEYELKPADDSAQQTALLTRRAPVDSEELFASSAGYYEAKISSLDDLTRFMGQVDDLTYASVKDGLTVGGRKIKGHNYRGIRIEEIAALYQSEAKLRGGRSAHTQKIDDFNARWANRTYTTEAEKKELELEHDREEAALTEELRQGRSDGGFVDGSGFSLDPTFDYPALAREFEGVIAPRFGGVIDPQNIQRAREGLANKNADPLFELLGEVSQKGEAGELLARLTEQIIKESHGFQAARYDGELKGTEAGMVLFYTDLLAKLWAMNYQNSAPANNVPGFLPMTGLPVSSIYQQELKELSNTRLWFGPRDKGYQVADKGENVLFARTATRVYAASSNSLKPGVESQPNAHSAAFLGWWDDHYEEIARFEPEYERLNEVMKWSLVVTWLNQKDQASKLVFLQNVPVERGNWFPDWVTQHPQLRYAAWDKIGFFKRGNDPTATESLPRLRSETYRLHGQERWLMGGVSLAREETFAKRVALSGDSQVVQVARRSNLNYAPGESTGSALKTLEGTTYQFRNASPKQSFATATAKDGSKLRGSYGEVANLPVERIVTHETTGLKIGASLGDSQLGELTVANSRNGFRAGWASRDVDTGSALARRLSMSPDPEKVLALDQSVEEAIRLSDAGYLIKLEGSERWMKLVPERGPTANLEPGYAARVGEFDAKAKNYNLAWVKAEDISTSLREGNYVVRSVSRNPLFKQLSDGNYDTAVRELVRAPDEFKAQLEQNLSTSIAECKDLMRSEQYGAVSRRVDDLIQIYGSREELRLHKVVAELNVPLATRNRLAEVLTQGNRPSVLDEVSARLNSDLARNGETFTISSVGDDLTLRYTFPSLKDAAPIARGEVGQGKALVYIQDTPGLNNLDWQTSPGRSLDAAIAAGFKVIKLPRGDVARFKPATLYDNANGIIFKASSTGGTGGGWRRPRYFSDNPGGGGIRRYRPFPLPCPDEDNDQNTNDDDCDDEDKDTVIVIVRK
jgi:hypothetical protein